MDRCFRGPDTNSRTRPASFSISAKPQQTAKIYKAKLNQRENDERVQHRGH